MEVGTKVKGEYMGEFPFTGKIIDRRPLYVRTDGAYLHEVELDCPIEVFGGTKTMILMHTLWDGGKSSYTQYTDWMEKI